jgi:predicted translin family RNA/ssDNA-binding protein
MPQPPYLYRVSGDTPTARFDISSLGQKINEQEKKRQDAFEISRKLQVAIAKARNDLEVLEATSSTADEAIIDAAPTLEQSLLEAIVPNNNGKQDTNNARTPRTANLSMRVEEYLRLLAFSYFLKTATLLAPSSTFAAFATDEEYLAGACMGLCQDLAAYGMGRATARDGASVTQARDLVQEILEYLLSFDFRNGYLRRKYDRTKYALNTLETILYELSVTGRGGTSTESELDGDDDGEEPPKKRAKQESSTASIKEELNGIHQRMEHRDDLRETLIKKCRDGQKAAKQAIYALQRDDPARARELLTQCEECITKELLPIIQEEPPLRGGSFSNVMEEYAEAKLFYVWLLGKEGEGSSKDCIVPSNVLLNIKDFSIALEPQEYLGGLCELTGEIGRYAVQRGKARDFDGVKGCLEANVAIKVAIQTMERVFGSTGKKIVQLRRSVEKIERLIYEMSLSEASGRIVAPTDVPLEPIIFSMGIMPVLGLLERTEIKDPNLPAIGVPGFPAV